MKHLKVFLTAWVILGSACGGVRAGNPRPPAEDFAGVAGRVTTVVGGKEVPIAAVTVAIGEQAATTDAQGAWRIATATPAGKGEWVAVTFTAPGYASLVRTYRRDLLSGSFLAERLRPVAAMRRMKVKDGGAIVVPGADGTKNDVAIRFPPGFAKLENPEVDVAVSMVRPQIEEELAAFPGSYFGVADDLANGIDLLRTLGTVEVSFSNGGAALENMELTKPVDMMLRLDDAVATDFPEGATIPAWWLNTGSGAWEGEGHTRVVVQNGEKYASWSVKHFTWWNVDKPLETHACVAVKLNPVDENARQVLADLQFTVAGVDYAGVSAADVFGEDGLAVVSGWLGHPVRPIFGFRSGPVDNALTAYVASLVLGDESSFKLPTTLGSAVYKKGPGGVPLEPKEHCRYIERDFDLKLGQIKGTVLDEYGRPLSGAVVAVSELGRTAVSDQLGSFRFAGVPWREDGSLTVTVAALPPATHDPISFTPIGVVRDAADATVVIVADPLAGEPLISSLEVANTTPPAGTTTSFRITIDDDDATLLLALDVCGETVDLTARHGEAASGKTVICHYPPGNRENVQTLSVGDDAVGAHLAHGDSVGVCPGVDVTSPPRVARKNGNAGASAQSCSGSVETVTVETGTQGRKRYHLRGDWKVGATRGKQLLTVLAKDPLGYVSSRTAEIHVRNNAPVVLLDAPSYATYGDAVTVAARVTDPDGDGVSYTWVLNGVAMLDTGPAATLTGLLDGPNYLELAVSDGQDTVTQRHTLYAVPPVATPGQAPETWINAPASVWYFGISVNYGSPTTNWVLAYECRVDDGPFEACPAIGYRSFTVGSTGLHTIAVRAVIVATGVADPTPAFATIDVRGTPPYTSYSVGRNHICGVRADAKLYCWGLNDRYQMGQGGSTGAPPEPAPVLVNLMTWLSVSAEGGIYLINGGHYKSCGIRSDRTLWCWGDGAGNNAWNTGILGSPGQIGGANDWAQVDLAEDAACGIKTNQTLWCWGQNNNGQAALTGMNIVAPTQVTGGTIFWRDVAVGYIKSCGVGNDGSLWCWGSGLVGLVRVGTASDWEDVAVGADHYCARKTTQTLWCWGWQGNGAVGNGSTSAASVPAPVQIGTAADWTSITTSQYGTCGTRGDGTLWCWGTQYYGELGFGAVLNRLAVPTRVGGDSDWVSVSNDRYNACALKSTGKLYCWGTNGYAKIGNGTEIAQPNPLPILGTAAYSSLSAAASTACAVEAGTGILRCWGNNDNGQLGDGTLFSRQAAVNVVTNQTFVSVSPGTLHACGLESSGRASCWGDGLEGKLGTGNTTDSPLPKPVNSTQSWAEVSVGNFHSCGRTTAGYVYCWGRNSEGQLGAAIQGAGIYSTPVSTAGAKQWLTMDAGGYSACAIRNDNSLWCWGGGTQGELGTGSASNVTLPTNVAPGSSWLDISVGFRYACGIRSDGSLWCWGNNFAGQVGMPAGGGTSTPYHVGAENDWQQVSAGNYLTCALKTNGSLWCWGWGGSHIPAQIGAGTTWLRVAAQDFNACAIRSDQSVHCWGVGSSLGALANGLSWYDFPTRVTEP